MMFFKNISGKYNFLFIEITKVTFWQSTFSKHPEKVVTVKNKETKMNTAVKPIDSLLLSECKTDIGLGQSSPPRVRVEASNVLRLRPKTFENKVTHVSFGLCVHYADDLRLLSFHREYNRLFLFDFGWVWKK